MEVLLTDREHELMEILWDRGSATVAEVREGITDELARNTVLTFLRRLEDKGYVRHEEEGRAHRYYATLSREEATESALSRLTRTVFRGSRALLLTHLVSDRDLPEEEARKIRALLDVRLGDEVP